MKYVPQGYSIWNNGDRFYWQNTSEENAVLNPRELSRTEGHEKKPLWELMGKTFEEWETEHAAIRQAATAQPNDGSRPNPQPNNQ